LNCNFIDTQLVTTICQAICIVSDHEFINELLWCIVYITTKSREKIDLLLQSGLLLSIEKAIAFRSSIDHQPNISLAIINLPLFRILNNLCEGNNNNNNNNNNIII
jgi:hypothetical protein